MMRYVETYITYFNILVGHNKHLFTNFNETVMEPVRERLNTYDVSENFHK